jgi:aminocarboxymuconate-semialdehyde decarboxylase
VRPECKKIERRPADYLDRMLVGSVVYSPDITGVNRVGLGSNYPYDMADEDAVSRVTQIGLPASSVESIMSENIQPF